MALWGVFPRMRKGRDVERESRRREQDKVLRGNRDRFCGVVEAVVVLQAVRGSRTWPTWR